MMPYDWCKKINADPQKSNTQIIQLNQTRVKFVGEIKEVVIRLSSNPNIFQVIDIVVMDILEEYGLLLNKVQSSKVNGYFVIDWSHHLFPCNGKPNQIRVNSEKHMNYVITELNHPNKLVMFSNLILANYFHNTFFGEFEIETCNVVESHMQFEVLHFSKIAKLNRNIVDSSKTKFEESKSTNIALDMNFWNLYFDIFDCKEGVGVGSILIDPKGNQILMVSCLESVCANNTSK